MMKTEIKSDGRTVWVNGEDGCCLARFSRFGIDIHNDAKGQVEGEQCLQCSRIPDWAAFKAGCLEHHGVTVDDSHKPLVIPV